MEIIESARQLLVLQKIHVKVFTLKPYIHSSYSELPCSQLGKIKL